MSYFNRRGVLGLLGSAVATIAGCSSEAEPGGSDGGGTVAEEREESLREYLPASIASDSMTYWGGTRETLLEADSSSLFRKNLNYRLNGNDYFGVELESVETEVNVFPSNGTTHFLKVMTGDLDPEGQPVTREYAGAEYDLYDREYANVAVYDDVVLVSNTEETISDAIEAHRGDTDRLMDAEPHVEAGLSAVDGAHYNLNRVGSDVLPRGIDVRSENVDIEAVGETVTDRDTLETTRWLEFVDADHVTDALVSSLVEYVRERRVGPFSEEPSATVDDASVAVTCEVDLAARRERREYGSPEKLRVEGIDFDTEYLEIRILRGGPTPIENLTLELDGEPYDPSIWTDDRNVIRHDTVVRVRTVDLEPDLEVTLRHETPRGTVTSSTTVDGIRSTLEEYDIDLVYDRDPYTGDVTIEYRGFWKEAEIIPLPADEITVAVHDFGAQGVSEEPERTLEPWAGEQIEYRDVATVESVEPGQYVGVYWGDVTVEDALDFHDTDPGGTPGSVEFALHPDTWNLSLTLEFPKIDRDTLPAEAYEIRVDGSAAETQWSDQGETIESGSTVTLEDPEPGATVSVLYEGWDEQVAVDAAKVPPEFHVEIRYEDYLVLEHVGGASVPVEKLRLHVYDEHGIAESGRLDEVADGNFEPGESIAIELDHERADVEWISLVYGRRPWGIGWLDLRD